MTTTAHNKEAFLVIDPPQDFEEQLQIWGIYGSLKAAQAATPRLRRKHLSTDWDRDQRITGIQQWRGDTKVKTWEFRPTANHAGPAGWRVPKTDTEATQ